MTKHVIPFLALATLGLFAFDQDSAAASEPVQFVHGQVLTSYVPEPNVSTYHHPVQPAYVEAQGQFQGMNYLNSVYTTANSQPAHIPTSGVNYPIQTYVPMYVEPVQSVPVSSPAPVQYHASVQPIAPIYSSPVQVAPVQPSFQSPPAATPYACNT